MASQVLKESQVLKVESSALKESQVSVSEESQVFKEPQILKESQVSKKSQVGTKVESQVLKEESQVGPKIESQILKELTAAARTLDDRATDAWVAATSTGRLDLAELCCTGDSLLVDEMSRLRGTAERYSFWNGYDLSRRAGATKLLNDLLLAMPRRVWASPPCGPDSNIQNFNAHRRTPEHAGAESREQAHPQPQDPAQSALDHHGAGGHRMVRVLPRAARELRILARNVRRDQ